MEENKPFGIETLPTDEISDEEDDELDLPPHLRAEVDQLSNLQAPILEKAKEEADRAEVERSRNEQPRITE